MTTRKALIYDFETLSQDPFDGAAVSLAYIVFDMSRFESDSPYTFKELIDLCTTIKFDVADQVQNYGRKISKETLAWWGMLPPKVKETLKPSSSDILIAAFYELFTDDLKRHDLQAVYTRGNNFDPVFLASLMKATKNPEPYSWWLLRDTRSFIEGLSFGTSLRNDFIPPDIDLKQFLKHVPSHDVAIDVLRMQYLVRALGD